MLKIGDFSKLSKVSIRMLRHYDEIGLLHPAQTDRFTGYRYYGEDQLRTAGRIRALCDMGFSLAAVREVLRCCDDPVQTERLFAVREAELRADAAQTAYRLRLLETAREWLRKGDTQMKYDVTVKTIPERYAATVRMTLPSYEAEGMGRGVLNEETDAMGLIPDDPCLCCAVFHDREYRETDVDVEVQKTVKGHYPDTAHVCFRTLPPVTVAGTVHNGSYDHLDAAMEAVARWVQANGYAFDGPAFNIYHVSPHETQDAEQFVTEVCYPVRRL